MSKLKGTRLDPEQFPLTTKRALEASKRGLDPQETFDDFVDYWTALPGSKALTLDWEATWRSWCRKARSFLKPWQVVVTVSQVNQKDQADIAALHARRQHPNLSKYIGTFRNYDPGETVSQYRRAQNDAIDEGRTQRQMRIVK